jgi:hypothetical protein
MNSGELAEGDKIVLRDVIAHSLQKLFDFFGLSRLDPGDYCKRYLMRHKTALFLII